MQTAYVACITGSFRNSSLVIRLSSFVSRNSSLVIRLSSFVTSSAINLHRDTTDKG
ncbi:Uncharacterised protein [Capnocytophaga sputigena]|uniref:Uncharacterized protein n=1 Tax=Capnocytophaga sputigena TaxID=1019 RepID=A0AAX2IB85_CAPSP|nr:Uncharacterised protein [Capnocytophaga sputigena]